VRTGCVTCESSPNYEETE
ncbi:hypothetical protein JMJ77_0010043, partial [Colletotrichum scovillei]